jgi:nucleoside-diphosphate-sugar epimerase
MTTPGRVRIFLAGATGAIGRQLVPMLIGDGYAVTGTTRSRDKAGWLRSAGADAAVVDVFDAAALRSAVVAAHPDVVIHQLTDLAGGFGPEELRANSRLRQIGTRNLVDATLAAGARRLVAQSGAWLYGSGPLPHTETDPLEDPTDVPDDPVLAGIVELERLVTRTAGFDGIILRYGFLYGPGTVGDEPGREPTVHVAEAARAAALAVEHGSAGIYNIVDDGGEVSNRLARAVLGWRPVAQT